jgi:uncharacterized protein YdiU (UPF0061 family)
MKHNISMETVALVESETVDFHFDNTYARLPEKFYARTAPGSVTAPKLIKLNSALANQLNLDPSMLSTAEGIEVLAGNSIAAGSEPLAMAYAGHQFGNFVRQLGDGRTNLLGEVVAKDGKRYDIQLKGSGRTPFSRNGDGRAAIGPVLREYIVSEAMAALGVPTTRALAAVSTGQTVLRERALPGAILTRVASSHLRVGTFQYFMGQGDIDGVRELADYAIARHYPEAARASRKYRAFLDGVISRQASLVAQWMLLGFIHGVMNTDNTSISGETIDYGPCAFMEAYDSHMVFSSIDRQGRYGYSNQPHAMHWNMARLAETLLPLLVVEEEGSEEAGLASAHEALEQFGKQYEAGRNEGLSKKLGFSQQLEGDEAFADDLLKRMEENEADFTLTFSGLSEAAALPEANTKIRSLFKDPKAFETWESAWRTRLAKESISSEDRVTQMRRVNPVFIPRNHLVEVAIQAATQNQDYQLFEDLLGVLARPYETQPGQERYAVPARPEECVTQTFCGT